MTKMIRWIALAIGMGCSGLAFASATVTVDVDVSAVPADIQSNPNWFAFPHAVDIRSADTGVRVGDSWQLRIKVPGAVSLGIRAGDLTLPKGSELVVRDPSGATWDRLTEVPERYHSAPVAGDEIVIELHGAGTALTIDQLQVGFREPGMGYPTAPAGFVRKSAVGGNLDRQCGFQNYDCERNEALDPHGRATVYIVIDGSAACTATLINNHDPAEPPYLLTASHCAAPVGQTPGQEKATGIRVYYGLERPCGDSLNVNAPTDAQAFQYSATHLAAADDAWLVQLRVHPPEAANAHYMGVDLTDAEVAAMTVIHHSAGNAKQILFANDIVQGPAVEPQAPVWVMWKRGQTYELTNGASGSALVDPNGRVVGSMFGSTVDTCGVDDAMGTSGGPRLAAVANTPDAENGQTIAQFLAPDGVLVRDGVDQSVSGEPVPLTPFDFTVNGLVFEPGAPIVVSWDAPTAVQCRLSTSREEDGDPNAGIAGTRTLTVDDEGVFSISVTCTSFTDVDRKNVLVTIAERDPQPIPTLALAASPVQLVLGASSVISWNAGLADSCVATGPFGWGGVRAVSGSFTVTPNAVGTHDFVLACSSPDDSRQESVSVTVTAPQLVPAVNLAASPVQIVLGQSSVISWNASGATGCVATGPFGFGGNRAASGSRTVTPTSVGTHQFTMACSSPDDSRQETVTVTVTAPPVDPGPVDPGPGTPPPANGGGGSSGGSPGLALLLALGLAGAMRRRMR